MPNTSQIVPMVLIQYCISERKQEKKGSTARFVSYTIKPVFAHI